MTTISRISLEADSRQIRSARRDLQDLGREGVQAQSAVAGLGKALLGIAAAAISVRTVTQQFTALWTEQEKAQRNLLRTEALIKSTGGAAGFSALQLQEQARALARVTLSSTEGLMEAQQVLLSFRRVSGETFTRAIELATDMAAVMGGDTKSAVLQLGKALEDPVKGLSALGRSGTTFTDQQKALIESLVATGRAAEAQKVILDELAMQYGGTAKREAEGLAGAQDTLTQSIQEARIEFANYIQLGDTLSDLALDMASSFDEFTIAISSGEDALIALAAVDMGWLTTVLETVIVVAGNVKFALVGIGIEIGGIAAQAAALMSLDFAAFQSIGEEMRADAAQRRKDFDEWEQRVLNARANQSALNDVMSQARDGTMEYSSAVGKLIALEKAGVITKTMMEKALTELGTAAAGTATELGEVVVTGGEVEPVITAVGKAARYTVDVFEDLAKEMERQNNEFESLRRSLDPAYASMMRLAEGTRTLEDAFNRGLIGMGEFVELLGSLRESVKGVEPDIEQETDALTHIFEAAGERIDAAFSDAWKGAFDSYESFASSLKDAFRQLLGELAHAAITRPILLQLGTSMGTNLLGGATGGQSSGGGLGQMPMPGIGSMLGSGLISAGGALGAGTAVGGFATGMGTAMASGAGTLGTMSAGASLMGTAGGGAAGAGMIAGAALPWIGGALALGSILGIGKSGERFKQAGANRQGEFSDGAFTATGTGAYKGDHISGVDSTLDLLNASFTGKLGAFAEAVSDIYGTELPEKITIDTTTRLRRTSGRMASNIAGMIGDQSFTFGAQTGGDGDIQKGLSEFVELALTQGVAKAAKSVNPDLFGGETIESMTTIVEEFIALAQLMADDFSMLTTESERFHRAQTDLDTAFRDLGVNMPRSVDEFRLLADGIDLTTDEGRDLYASLYQLAPAFGEVASAVQAVFDSISKSTAESVRSIEMSILDSAGQYAYLDAEIDRMLGTLSESSAPAEIDELFQAINRNIMQSYNLLDEDEQSRLATQFIDRLYEAESIAQSRLSVTPAEEMTSKEQAEAAGAQKEAAAGQREAAFLQMEAAGEARRAAAELRAALAAIPDRIVITASGSEVVYA